MTTSPELASVTPTEVRPWRSDLEPAALPSTAGLTLGQVKVLQACITTFADKGFAGTSVRDVAAAAGMQSASLYNHFPSKEAMLHELVRMGYEHHLDRLMEAVLNAPSDPREQLAAAVRSHVLVHCEHPQIGLVTTYEAKHLPAEAMAGLRSLTERSRAVVIEILRRGTEQGVFHVNSPAVTLLALSSMGIDSARWFPHQEHISAEEVARDYAELALRMVGASS